MGMAGIGMLFTGVSAGLQVYSQMQAGKTAERVAKANNKNAEIEARNQESEFAEGVKRDRINQRKQMSTLRARLSTQGTRTETGTPMDILGETAGNFQLAISDAARATTMQTASIRHAGQMGIWEAKQAKKASTIAAIGTGIQGITSAVSAYGHNKYTGAIK